MQTPWIQDTQLPRTLARHEAFWRGDLEGGPLLWLTAPGTRGGPLIPEPASEEELWTNVDYAIAQAECSLARTHFAGDALPVFCPWLGPDQVAGWLGSDLQLKPKENTSWSKPFVTDWSEHAQLTIARDNRWWKLYQQTLVESVRVGKDKWITGYPDLHTGLDALSAIRGQELLAVDLLERPDVIKRAMIQMTELWKSVVDNVTDIVLPSGQGTSNWTMGWSSGRFLCIGQNDYSCMISARMFEEFCVEDNLACCQHVDHSLYHLDGPGALRHLPKILELPNLNCVQWIQGAGRPLPSKWLDLLRRIQASGKSVQLYYGPGHGHEANLVEELDLLCAHIDPDRLFVWAVLESADFAEHLVSRYVRSAL